MSNFDVSDANWLLSKNFQAENLLSWFIRTLFRAFGTSSDHWEVLDLTKCSEFSLIVVMSSSGSASETPADMTELVNQVSQFMEREVLPAEVDLEVYKQFSPSILFINTFLNVIYNLRLLWSILSQLLDFGSFLASSLKKTGIIGEIYKTALQSGKPVQISKNVYLILSMEWFVYARSNSANSCQWKMPVSKRLFCEVHWSAMDMQTQTGKQGWPMSK